MIPTCYTVRPGPGSGWVTFFELARTGDSQGFFLILGPGVEGRPDPDLRRLAQDVARAIVTDYKARRGDQPAEWLKQVRYRVSAASPKLEFGALLLLGEEIVFVCEGRVRVYPLTATARFRWERDIPAPGVVVHRRVEGGDRFFFGRVPPEAATGLPAAEMLEGVERAGARDGALILTFLASAAPARDEFDPGPAVVAEAPRASTGRDVAPDPPGVSSGKPPAEVVAAPVLERVVAEPGHAPPEFLPSDEVRGAAEPDQGAAAPPVVMAAPAGHQPGLPVAEADVSPAVESAGQPAVPELTAAALGTTAWQGREDEEERPRRWPWILLIVSAVAFAGYLAVLRPMLRGRAPAPASIEPVAAPVDSAPVTTPAGAEQAGIAWQARLGAAVTGTPLVLPDRVIVAARDGSVSALDRRDGSRLWTISSPKGYGGGPVLAESLVVVAGFDGVVRALDPGDGRSVWQFATGGRIASSPAVTREAAVVVGSYDRTLYGLKGRNGRLLWKTRLGGILWASPVAGRNYVYVAGLDGTITAVNAKWGSVLWKFPTRAEIYSAPATTDTIVVAGAENGSVYGLDAEEGHLRWKFDAGVPVGGGVGAGGGLFVVGDDGGTVHGLDALTGRQAWQARVGGAVKARPLLDAGGVVIAGHDGGLHALRLGTGETLGRFPVGSPMAAAPAVAGDTLFVGTHDGRVVALRLR